MRHEIRTFLRSNKQALISNLDSENTKAKVSDTDEDKYDGYENTEEKESITDESEDEGISGTEKNKPFKKELMSSSEDESSEDKLMVKNKGFKNTQGKESACENVGTAAEEKNKPFKKELMFPSDTETSEEDDIKVKKTIYQNLFFQVLNFLFVDSQLRQDQNS